MSDDDTDDGDDLETIAARIAAIAKANGSGGTSGATIVNLADAKAEIARLAQVDKVGLRARAHRHRQAARDASSRPWTTSSRRRGSRTSPPRMMGESVLSLEELEAWPLRVDGAPLAEEIRTRLLAHVVFARTADADVATLWAIGTYLMDTWRLWPRLTITSPTRQCGKTTLLEVLEAVVMRGLAVSNATSASIFRAIEGWRPTLLCDEADTWMKDNKELSGVLNSGHTRRTARVIRTEENKSGGRARVPTLFSTWAAMVIAGIGSQRDTLMSRSIVVSLARKLPGESVERMPSDLHERMLQVRRQILRWTNDNKVRIGAMDVEPPPCGDDRRLDNHTPVWRVALALGGPWPDRIAAAYAAGSPAGAAAEEPTNVLLLGDVHDTFVRHGASRISTSRNLLQELLGMLGPPMVGIWATAGR